MGILAGKVAIITGALGGLGQAMVKHYADQGARIVQADLSSPEEIEHRADMLSVRLDVTQATEWEEAIEAAIRHFGKVDILVNNAGYYLPRPLMETTEPEMQRHYDVNQLGPFLGMRAVVPAMQASGGGAIVNISSGAGLRGHPGMFAYSAAKWALRGMTKCASAELAPLGIRVNSIYPGAIATPMLDRNDPAALAALEAAVPLGQRRGQPEDVARIAAFLASDAAGYITGAEVAVDGGISA